MKQELKAEIDKVLADKEIGIPLLTEKFRKGFSGCRQQCEAEL